VIDGQPGILVVGEGSRHLSDYFYWHYYMNDQTSIMGWNTMPWDNGTLEFLKTIHIEKIKGG
jgi:hypothetical protein